MPTRSTTGADQGIVRDDRGQEQPRNKERAQQVSRKDKGNPRREALTRWALRIVARGADEDDPRCMSCVTPWIEA